MVKFTVEQKLQALNLLKEVCSTCSLAQIIGTESHQAIDIWAAQYQHFGVLGLEIRHTPQNYRGQFKLLVSNRRKEHDETYQEIVTDISEFRYGNKSMSERLYFSPFKDLFSGEIISYTISQRPQTKYVLEGLKQVLTIRPKLPYRMTIYSDQGIQYQSKAYCQTLKQHHVFQSVSRRATCHDNRACESLFHFMKVEQYRAPFSKN